jgi:hypothetical protein
MSWREAFLVRFGAGALTGITLGRWLRMLRDNRFAVDRPYWGRAAVITLASIPNTLLAAWENRHVRRGQLVHGCSLERSGRRDDGSCLEASFRSFYGKGSLMRLSSS